MQLQIDASPASAAALAIAGWAGYQTTELPVIEGKFLSIEGSSAGLTDMGAVFRGLASHKNRQDLLGHGAEEQKRVNDWLELISKYLFLGAEPIKSDYLAKLDGQLASLVFLAGGSYPTIADAALFAALRQPLSSMNAKERASVPNVLRWFDHIQGLSSSSTFSSSSFPSVSIIANPSQIYSTIFPESKLSTETKGNSKESGKENEGKIKNEEGAKGKEKGKETDKNKKEQPKKEVKKDNAKEAKAAAPAKGGKASASAPVISKLDVRVGHVLSAKPHPTEKNLYVEEIEVGESAPRTVVSGLAEVLSLEELKGRNVLVIVNVKAGDLKGVMSAGRVLVATGSDGKKELCEPPKQAKVGERVSYPGVEVIPDDPISGKHFHKLLKELHTSANRVVQFGDLDFMTSAGPCTVPSVANGTVA